MDKIANFFQGDEIQTVLWSIAFDILTVILIVIVLSIIKKVGNKFIKKAFAINIDRIQKVTGGTQRRKDTLEGLSLNIWKYFINIVLLLCIASVFVNPAVIFSGAGAAVVVIGLAAKTMLNDLMMGFFIVFEDMFSVGDFIEVNGVSGTVLEIGLRATKVRAMSGETITVPNGSVGQVTNFSVSNGTVIIDVSVAYEADLEFAIEVLEELAFEARNKYQEIVELPKVLGVQSLGSSEIHIRLLAEVEPLQQWYIKRELNKMIKLKFDEKGIEIPFPRMVVYSKNEA